VSNIAPDPAAHQRHVRAVVARDVIEVGVEAGARAIDRREIATDAGDRGDEVVRDLAEAGDVQIALGGEVVIEQALRDLRLACDVVDRDVVVRAIGERGLREPEELGASLIVVETDATRPAANGAADRFGGASWGHGTIIAESFRSR
jgi:hypothetical protein